MSDRAATDGMVPMPPPERAHLGVGPASSAAWAQVQARYVMAQARPRNWAQVRYELLHECQNLRFAQESFWELTIGREARRDFTIRFAAAAARAMQNIHVQVQRHHEDANERVMEVSVTDLESNYGYSQEVVVDKFVLRKKPPADGPPVVAQRNQYGQPLYRHPASEQDLLAKENAQTAKVRRNLILSFVPGWLKEDCKVELAATLRAGGNKIAGQLPRDILNAFADLGVSALELNAYLGHDIITSTVGEQGLLRSLAAALREQELTWAQAMEARQASLPGQEMAASGGEAAAGEGATPTTAPARGRPRAQRAAPAAAKQQPPHGADEDGPAAPPPSAPTPSDATRPPSSSAPEPSAATAATRSQMLVQQLRRRRNHER